MDGLPQLNPDQRKKIANEWNQEQKKKGKQNAHQDYQSQAGTDTEDEDNEITHSEKGHSRAGIAYNHTEYEEDDVYGP